MKILQINTTANTCSHGRIAELIGECAIKKGWESYIAYGRRANGSSSRLIRIGSQFETYTNALAARLFDNEGLNAKNATLNFLKEVEKISPNLIHLHNLHGYYINYEILFDFLKSSKIPTVWTLHDCWSFTGHCSHYENQKCYKWKTQCSACPLKSAYPSSFLIDNSFSNYNRKKAAFTSLDNLTLQPVSYWLDRQLKESFFKNTKSIVLQNGIDLNKFFPQKGTDEFKRKFNLSDKKIVLGVASIWHDEKGFQDFIKLAQLLPSDYLVAMIGVSKKQVGLLPKNILSVSRTESISELAMWYTIADVFVNPTYNEALGLTNIEALACGTPVITYDAGGSPETIDQNTGFVVSKGNIDGIVRAIEAVIGRGSSSFSSACIARAYEHFNQENVLQKEMSIYSNILGID